MDVGPVALLGALVQVVVAADELLQLGLHIEDLVLGEVVFDHGHLGRLEVRQEAELARLQEQQRPALLVGASRRPADAVDVVTRVVWRVKLHDPVNLGNVETASRNVGADQGALLGVAELEEGVCSLLLLLLAVQVEHLQINVLQKLAVVLDRVARREEDDDLLLGHLLEEREEEEEALVGLDDDVSLVEALHRAVLLFFVDVDVERPRTERNPGEVFDLCCLCGREEHRLPVLLGQDLDNLAHFVLEADFQDAVGLVDDQGLEVLEDERGILEICTALLSASLVLPRATRQSRKSGALTIEQSAGRRDQEVDTLAQLFRLGPAVRASNDNSV